MTMLADVVAAVVGGDTHRDSHALELVSPAGVPITTVTIDNDDAGFARALTWIAEHAPPGRIVVALEGTRSYGIGLARACATAGYDVLEVERPRRGDRRRGKSDPGDAHLAALAALRVPADRPPVPRGDGPREALRILLTARADLVLGRTGQINRLRALLLTGDDADRQLARGRLPRAVLTRLARRPGAAGDDLAAMIRRHELHRLATAIIAAADQLTGNAQQLTEIVQAHAPQLIARRGIGPVCAAQAIVSWSHRGRCRSDAAFAALAGASPVPASSGRVTRHRLNRGGDRALNRALHDITLTRWRCCPRTRAYVARRRAEGKTDTEIRRCLKRYIARELYRTLERHP